MAHIMMQQEEEMIVDEETGLIQKVETVTVAARDEYGNVIVRQHKRAVAARVLPPQIQRVPQQRALVSSTRDRPVSTRVEDWKPMKLFKLCLLPFFIPCVCSRKSLVVLLLLILGCVVTGTVFIGIGPLHNCTSSLYYVSTSTVLLVIFGTILYLSISCCCFAYYTDEGDVMSIKPPQTPGRDCQICWMFIAWFFGMVLLALVAIETSFVFSDIDKVLGKGQSQLAFNATTGQLYYNQTVYPCHFEQSILAGLVFSYVLIVGFGSCWCLVFKEIYESW